MVNKEELRDITKEYTARKGFEIVAFAGEARSMLIKALNEAEKGCFDKADALVQEAGTSLVKAHNVQTRMLAAEARGNNVELGFITVHAQDHLMNTMLLKDIIKHLFNIYKKSEQ